MSLPDMSKELAALRGRMLSLQMAAATEDENVGSLAVAELETAFEELRTMQEELRAQQEQLRSTSSRAATERTRADQLFSESPDAPLVTDANGIIRRANPRAAALFGVDLKRLVAKPLAAFVSGIDRRTFRSGL